MFSKLLLCSVPALAVPVYKHDPTWQPEWPQTEGVHIYSAVAVSGGEVFVSNRGNYSQPVLVFDRSGKKLREFGNNTVGIPKSGHDGFGHTWGGHGLTVQPADLKFGRDADVIWVMDCEKNQVHSFGKDGTHLASAGEKGYAADGFGCVADATRHSGIVYFADGDAKQDNRVEAWASMSGVPERPLWSSEPAGVVSNGTGLQHFSWPHSIAWHETSGRLLVADRGAGGQGQVHSRIAILDPLTHKIEGNLTCEGSLIDPHAMPAPFAVRTLRTQEDDLLFVALGDVAPQDGNPNKQFIQVVDLSMLAVDGSCRVVQTIPFTDPTVCDTPHLLGLDRDNGDVYLSCVDYHRFATGSNIVRISQVAEVLTV